MQHRRFSKHFVAVLVGFLILTDAQSWSAILTPGDYNFTVTTDKAWTDTGLDLLTGEVVQISAGAYRCAPQASSQAAPEANLRLPSAPAGSLIARLHAQGASPLLVGTSTELKIEEPGHLYLGVNGTSCAATFAVKVHVTPPPSTADTATTTGSAISSGASASLGARSSAAGQSPQNATTATPADSTAPKDMKSKLATAAQTWLAGQFGAGATTASATNSATSGNTPASTSPTATPLKLSNTPLDAALRKDIDDLPRRVRDRFNNLGDMVNFVMVGSQEQIQTALTAANWNVADTDDKEAAFKAVLQTYQKKDYLAMPMSGLYLFDRRQDFGYEEADPYAVVATRHHFRIWKAAFTYNGQTVWVGAGTHDIGFEKDQRNGKVTHKIDPAVDGERENIGRTLQHAGKVKSLSYYLPPDPVQEAKNATGGGYHSDGRILVIFLQ